MIVKTSLNRSRIIAIAIAAALVALLIVYYLLNPSDYQLFPKCVIHSLTGYQCPSCGSQRALHAFLHGNFAEAFRYNFFAIYSVSYFLLVLLCFFGKFSGQRMTRLKRIVLSRIAAITYVVLYVAWWIIRNTLGI